MAKLIVGINDLWTTHAHIADKIISHDPKTLTKGMDKKVISRCPDCSREWSARVADLTQGNGCPKCAGRVFDDLWTTDPEVAARIISHDPKTLTKGMGKKVISKCSACSHEWPATVGDLTKGSGCPKCAGRVSDDLWTTDPEVASRIISHDPKTLTRGMSKKVISKCSACSHEWPATVNNLTKGSGCSACAGRVSDDLWTTHPDVAARIISHDSKTLTKGMSKKVISRCPDCSREWSARVADLTQGNGCPACAGRVFDDLWTTDPEVAAKIISHDPKTLTKGSGKKVISKCSACSHEWPATVNNLTKGHGCPNCAEYGFNPQQKAIVYLMQQSDKMKIGITNLYGNVCENSRIKNHQSNGWELVDWTEFNNGQDALNLEQTVLAYLDGRNIGRGRAVFLEAFDGYTECWRAADYSPSTIAIIGPPAC
jgi:DNA-directed RNA polymerase subunit RPC12/RpoP